MAITTPANVNKIDDNQVAYGSPTSEATFKQMSRNQNYLIDSVPIGTIVAFAINQPGVPSPNPDIWQLCDGSEITQEDSPLKSSGAGQRYTPDLTDKFLRGSTTGNAGNFAGADSVSISDTPGYSTTDATHITNDLEAVISIGSVSFNFGIVPGHYTVAYYMKIN